MASSSWIVSSEAESTNGSQPETTAASGQIVPTTPLPYTQGARGIQLEAPGVVAGYARPGTAVPITVGLLRGLLSRWKSALFLGLLLGTIAAAATFYLNPAKYKAAAVFRIDATEPTVMTDRQRGASPNTGEAMVFMRDQLNLVKSPPVLRAALNDEKIRGLTLVRDQKDPVSWLGDEIKVAIPEGTDLMVLSLSGQRPEELAELVRAVRDSYFAQIVNAERNEKRRELTLLENIVKGDIEKPGDEGLEGKVRGQKDKYFDDALKLASVDSQVVSRRQQLLLEEYGVKNRQLTDQIGRRNALQLKLKELQATVAKGRISIPEYRILEQVDADPKVTDLLNKIQEKIALVDKVKQVLRNSKGSAALARYQKEQEALEEELKGVKERVHREVEARLRRRILGETQILLEQSKSQIEDIKEQIKELTPDVDRLRREIDSIGIRHASLEMQRSELEAQEQVLKQLRDQIHKLNVELQNTKTRVKLLAGPDVPERPDYKMQAIFVAVAGVLGLVLGVVGVSYRAYRAGKINSSAEVAQDLGLRVVGTLPPLSGRLLAGGASPKSRRDVYDQSLLIESIDGIRTMLLCDDQTDAHRILMITSANAREGKTMLASHLAGSIARTGRRTLLIDCDLRRPGIHRLFDAPETPGMSELLRKEVQLADAIRPTRLDHLYVLAAGKCDRQAVEGLARQDLSDLLSQLRTEYDFVIIDSCPVLPVPDALLISKLVDGVVLSVRPTVSHAASVFAACERLQAMGVPLMGTVVNGDRAHANGLDYDSLLQTS
jgi:polysaccharide biosynthesis transport protein